MQTYFLPKLAHDLSLKKSDGIFAQLVLRKKTRIMQYFYAFTDS